MANVTSGYIDKNIYSATAKIRGVNIDTQYSARVARVLDTAEIASRPVKASVLRVHSLSASINCS